MEREDIDNVDERVAELREKAHGSNAGRAAYMLRGGPNQRLTQTVIALRAGASLSEHENPGEATVLVLEGRVRMAGVDGQTVEGGKGDLLSVPPERHGLEALADSTVLLTAAKLH